MKFNRIKCRKYKYDAYTESKRIRNSLSAIILCENKTMVIIRKCFISHQVSHREGQSARNTWNSDELFLFHRTCASKNYFTKHQRRYSERVDIFFSRLLSSLRALSLFFSFLHMCCWWLPFIKRLQYRVICGNSAHKKRQTSNNNN